MDIMYEYMVYWLLFFLFYVILLFIIYLDECKETRNDCIKSVCNGNVRHIKYDWSKRMIYIEIYTSGMLLYVCENTSVSFLKDEILVKHPSGMVYRVLYNPCDVMILVYPLHNIVGFIKKKTYIKMAIAYDDVIGIHVKKNSDVSVGSSVATYKKLINWY